MGVGAFRYSRVVNPVLSHETVHVRDPAVLVHGDLAYVFMTVFDPQAQTWHVGLTTTSDFVTFGDLRLISAEGYASPGNVIPVGDEWVLCYQQYREFPHYICLSRSRDLVTWGPPTRAFNTGPENDWNSDGRVIDPYVVAWDGGYYCYYTGSTRWQGGSGHNLIGVAFSTDLATWQDLSPAAPIIGVDHAWEGPDGNENNCVIRQGDRWVMLYSASLAEQKIAWAVSDDLVRWEKQGLCSVPSCAARAKQCGAPFVIEGLADPGTYHMLCQARDAAAHMSFLLLESDDLAHWH